MVAITFAIMDYGVAIFVQNVLYNAVREGVRYAVTQQTNSGHQDTDIKAVVQSNSMGFLSGSSGASYISITYYNPKTLATVTGVGSNAGGNICMVSVNSFPITWFAPVWRASGKFAMSANSSDIMEAPPGGTIPSR
jgi:Flp pilus assembly protein TadG